MGEFFKEWRRKTGCVALVLACVFAGEWVHSLTYFRWISFFEDENKMILWTLFSQRGKLTVARAESGYLSGPPLRFYMDGPVRQVANRSGVPYCSIVIPLTLLSTYLLVAKPRPKKTIEPVPAEGT